MNKVNIRTILLYHWRQAIKSRRLALTSFIVAPITIVIERYATPLIIAALLMGIQEGTVTLASNWWMIVAYAGLQILTQVIGYRINLYAMWGVQVEGSRRIYHDAYEKLTRQSLDFYNNNFAGSLVSRINRFVGAYTKFWNTVIFEALFMATAVVATLVGTAILMWQFAVILLALVVLFVIASYYGTRFMRPKQKARSKAYTKLSAQISDTMSNMFAVKIDGKESYERRRLAEPVDAVVDKEYDARKGVISVSTAYSSIISTMRIMVLSLAIWAVEAGMANTATVYLLFTYTFNLIDELRGVTATFRNLYEITGDSEEILDTFNAEVTVPDNGKNQLKVPHGTIELKNVRFRHPEDSTDLFADLNLSIPAGQKVGIVGASGSGKTTLTRLLMRFVDINDGSISIDDTPIHKVTQTSLRESIAYVPQEPLLFHRSVSENIAYAKPDSSHKDIENAAKKAHAIEFIKTLVDEFNTLVGERGVKLSGGQRQRIAIARAILKDAPILVLDEATSALDSESEKLIQASLDELMKDRTSIVIAHRLSTIAKLDRIIVLDKGRIVEDGAHNELIEQKGIYANLWNHQSGGFIKE